MLKQKEVKDAFGLAQSAIETIVANLGDTLGAWGLKGTIRTSLEIDARTYTEKPEIELSVQNGVAYVPTSAPTPKIAPSRFSGYQPASK
ncbi:MAG: hypothetical protein Q8Q41_00720 [bacterium]|nr:hypothetical protein [bacterium]